MWLFIFIICSSWLFYDLFNLGVNRWITVFVFASKLPTYSIICELYICINILYIMIFWYKDIIFLSSKYIYLYFWINDLKVIGIKYYWKYLIIYYLKVWFECYEFMMFKRFVGLNTVNYVYGQKLTLCLGQKLTLGLDMSHDVVAAIKCNIWRRCND